jgi:penicillin-binding protein 1A
MTRVHAADGSLLAEYSRERRLYLPSDEIPDLVKHAFISAEDKNFYNHWGVDPEGIVRAAMVYMQGSRHIQGASTITQQVAKNFLLNSDRTFDRKIREILLSLRILRHCRRNRVRSTRFAIMIAPWNGGITLSAAWRKTAISRQSKRTTPGLSLWWSIRAC